MWNLLKSEKRIKKDFLIIPLSIPIHHNTDKECSKIYHPIAEKKCSNDFTTVFTPQSHFTL